jgi:hypothetical protein
MNAANLPGRIIPNHLAGYFGINNLMIISAMVCAAIIFSFIAVHDAAGLIVVAIIYGFASGTCQCSRLFGMTNMAHVHVDISLLAPMLANLADHDDELG